MTKPDVFPRKLLVLLAAGGLASLVVLSLIAPGTALAASLPADEDFDNYFLTPSGKTVCVYSTYTGVGCAVGGGYGSTSYHVHPRGRADRQTVTRGPRGNPVTWLAKARYGVTYRYHGITCRIGKTRGIRCINRSGHGFRVSVEHQRRF